MPTKLIRVDTTSAEELVLQRFPVVLGRGQDADICLPDRWISRRQCELYEVDGTLMVRDLGSSNGTLVNGKHVRQATLLPGDRLTIGMISFVAAIVSDSSGADSASTLQNSIADRVSA